MTIPAIDNAVHAYLDQHRLPLGTTLENRVTMRLHRWKVLDQCQYRVGPYRLDYAWPDLFIGLEVDGPHHWQPDNAVKDLIRDSYLREHGWLIFRVSENRRPYGLDEQLCRVVRVIRTESENPFIPSTESSSA